MSSKQFTNPDLKHAVDDFAKYELIGRNTDLNVVSKTSHNYQKPDNPIVEQILDDLDVELPEQLIEWIKSGDDPKDPVSSKNPRFGSRSEAVWAVARGLLRAGAPLEIIAGLLINPDYGISAHILDRPNSAAYAWRQVTRAAKSIEAVFQDVNKAGVPIRNVKSAITAIHLLGIWCGYDQFSNRLVIDGHVIQHYTGEVSDKAFASLRKIILDSFGFDPSLRHVMDAVTMLALENPYHPVLDYLEPLVWDGYERLENMFINYFSAEDTEINRLAGQIMMVAAVRRVKHPGVKFDIMVVIEGPQSTGKSTAIHILASAKFFSDQSLLSLNDKEQMEAVEGIWMYEVAELDGINRTETSKMKAFITRQVDRARRAYGYFRESWPRQIIFVGTTNESFYLKDTTGNRRFLPIKTGAIELEGLRRDRDQLWAEAVHLEAEKYPIFLSEEMRPLAAEVQEARMQVDPWLDVLADVEGTVVGGEARVHTETLFGVDILGIPVGQRQSFQPKRIAENMRKLGWEGPIRLRIGTKSLQGYRRLATSKNEIPI
jgi:predicted P-loop ATPase